MAKKIPFRGQSMNPSFRKVDFIWVDFDNKSPQLGEIVVYRDKHQELVCHRLIYKTQDEYWLKGDFSFQHEVVPASQFFGQVQFIEVAGKIKKIKPPFLYRWGCWLQVQHSQSRSSFSKKFYRYGVRLYFSAIHFTYST